MCILTSRPFSLYGNPNYKNGYEIQRPLWLIDANDQLLHGKSVQSPSIVCYVSVHTSMNLEEETAWDEKSIFDLPCDHVDQSMATETIQLSENVDIVIESAAVQVWGSARLLAAWLLTPEARKIVYGRSILEVGAGLGLPSMASAIAGASIAVATDISQGCVDALQRLLSERYADTPWAAQVESYALNWNDCSKPEFEPRHVVDVVIAADCHYYYSALQPLVAAIQRHLKPAGTLILASREGRISLAESRTLLVQNGFQELERINLRSEILQYGLDDDHFATLYRAPP